MTMLLEEEVATVVVAEDEEGQIWADGMVIEVIEDQTTRGNNAPFARSMVTRRSKLLGEGKGTSQLL